MGSPQSLVPCYDDRMKKVSKILIFLLILVIIAVGLWLNRGSIRDARFRATQGDIPPAKTRQQEQTQLALSTKKSPASASSAVTTTAPAQLNLKVPMVFQAPTSNWDAVHEETCEEAAVLMLVGYTTDIASYSRDEMETQLQKIIVYEKKTFGFFEDTTAAQTAQILSDYYGLKKIKILPITSIADIKTQIAAGRPVILPSSGKLLKNPNFKNGGPLYHMVVAKGYVGNKIITNDPGTRLGENYVYDQTVLFNAVHDWNGGDVTNGKKVMIVSEE